jgi:hypothetical protein
MNEQTTIAHRHAVLVCLAILLLGTACSRTEAPPGASHGKVADVSILTYAEQEAGIDPYPVRILTSTDYVRLDDGYDESDYVLFDRHSRTLYSVSHENRSVLEISNHPFDGPLPEDLTLSEIPLMDTQAPAIAGKQPLHTVYLANGTPCYQAISVSGLLDQAVAGMAEYAAALGERQLNNMQSVPDAMRTPCFLSRYVYAPGAHLTHGLPVQVWDEAGFSRSLTDFQSGETIDAALFGLPEDYDRIQMGQ